jgi:hypothetical protein
VGPSTTAPRIGVYPGSFDPPTIAHVHIAERAIEHFGLERVDFAISTMTLGKDDSRLSPISERVDELVAISEGNPALGVRTTHDSLLADIAAGYDLVILGADKWHQVLDPVWYGSVEARDEALRRLPVVALAPRPSRRSATRRRGRRARHRPRSSSRLRDGGTRRPSRMAGPTSERSLTRSHVPSSAVRSRDASGRRPDAHQ